MTLAWINYFYDGLPNNWSLFLKMFNRGESALEVHGFMEETDKFQEITVQYSKCSEVKQSRGWQATSPWVKSSQTLIFVNNVLLEHSYTHLLAYYFWLLSHYNGRIETMQQRLQSPQSLPYLLPGLYRKSLLTLDKKAHGERSAELDFSLSHT